MINRKKNFHMILSICADSQEGSMKIISNINGTSTNNRHDIQFGMFKTDNSIMVEKMNKMFDPIRNVAFKLTKENMSQHLELVNIKMLILF